MVDTSEHILLVAALFIFALLQLGLTRVLLNNNKAMVRTELDYTAVALAQNIADESRTKAFDEASTGSYIPLKVPDDFSLIGSDMGETYPYFDDFDDYHNYTRTDTTQHGIYKTKCRVEYMQESDLSQVSSVKTAYKRLHVEVVSETQDTVGVTYIKSYY
ncbi:type IV pilus modification PilV family protein [Fodinibius sediminis]|uniref:PilX N-terminal n=1 Tax=Fodinibius sediminis TaxID=1214077 RepID=A0A521EMU7_9BACT|nr:hypothetical protein [Fodinibius sediminis]SMO85255.1 hypothetical protein SAMN06265218_11767 [Fodinibius sediminis]